MADYGTTSYKNHVPETTEWDDIQRKLGNLPSLPEQPKPAPFEPKAEVSKNASWIESQSEQALEELEDDKAIEDDRFLEEYRRKRLAELKNTTQLPHFGSVELIKATDFVREVTHAGQDQFVLVQLYKDGHPACRALGECLEMLAPMHTSTKFVKIVSTECIPGYPDSNLPTLLVYQNTDVAHQFIGMQHFNGTRATPIDIERVMVRIGVFDALSTSDSSAGEAELEKRRREYMASLTNMSSSQLESEDSDFED
mmetsp:Transcript_15795/g.34244  ORF Transcript_15795/g.34244 Transcript_15795/m.34244 type:complete len:254 (-) Transcript_15795:171-932(-)|eukprot:CAMPEP_0118925274 /NCGR_PEP_ID=MMETSP1169-20130426/3194_1 /TAXON_ID=36882 /ORGANISM="Pyramimonas obovata, Strain CCMP722" /LENGTH=253 /DNA_ID=CAMNT_0006866525 /DNA_START=176 /DNA_END=937 /DNA_ORIENTATION=-